MKRNLAARSACASIVLACALVYSGAGGATVLGDMAAQMAAGEWRVLNTAGDGSGWSTSFLDAGNGHNILQYADKAKWDANTRRVLFIGKGAGATNQKYISYSDASNTWRIEPRPYWDCTPSSGCLGHAYQHNTIDPAGNHYYHLYYSTDYYVYTRATGQWSQLPGPSTEIGCCIGLEYFPEMAGGGLIAVGERLAYFFNKTLGTWTRLRSELAMGNYHNVAVYNPVHRIVVFGGGEGSRILYKIDASGTITRLADAPANVGVASSVFTVDPVSGKYLLISAGRTFHQYDVLLNRWTTLNAAAVPVFPPADESRFDFAGTTAAPITTYGVILFMRYDGAQSKVYLYKHTASVLDTNPPVIPQNPNVQ